MDDCGGSMTDTFEFVSQISKNVSTLHYGTKWVIPPFPNIWHINLVKRSMLSNFDQVYIQNIKINNIKSISIYPPLHSQKKPPWTTIMLWKYNNNYYTRRCLKRPPINGIYPVREGACRSAKHLYVYAGKDVHYVFFLSFCLWFFLRFLFKML